MSSREVTYHSLGLEKIQSSILITSPQISEYIHIQKLYNKALLVLVEISSTSNQSRNSQFSFFLKSFTYFHNSLWPKNYIILIKNKQKRGKPLFQIRQVNAQCGLPRIPQSRRVTANTRTLYTNALREHALLFAFPLFVQ